MSLRVGAIFLNPVEVRELEKDQEHFDNTDPIPGSPWPGVLRGYLFGAAVYEVSAVPLGHIALVPDGMVVCDFDGSASICLGLDAPDNQSA